MILSITVECPETKKEVIIKGQEFIDNLSCSSQECELCGSHTQVTFDYQCPHCKKSHEITLRDD